MGADQGLTRLFYDGNCGLCRGAVHFTAKRDRSGGLRFAPLGGSTFEKVVPPGARHGLPDSLLVLTPEGRLLARSGALLYLLGRMGPAWRLVGCMLAWIREDFRDAIYDWAARRRPRTRACPTESWSGDDRFQP